MDKLAHELAAALVKYAEVDEHAHGGCAECVRDALQDGHAMDCQLNALLVRARAEKLIPSLSRED